MWISTRPVSVLMRPRSRSTRAHGISRICCGQEDAKGHDAVDPAVAAKAPQRDRVAGDRAEQGRQDRRGDGDERRSSPCRAGCRRSAGRCRSRSRPGVVLPGQTAAASRSSSSAPISSAVRKEFSTTTTSGTQKGGREQRARRDRSASGRVRRSASRMGGLPRLPYAPRRSRAAAPRAGQQQQHGRRRAAAELAALEHEVVDHERRQRVAMPGPPPVSARTRSKVLMANCSRITRPRWRSARCVGRTTRR